MTETATGRAGGSMVGALGGYVHHENVLVRFGSLWVLLLALFMLVWTVSYYLLPEGLLRPLNEARTAPVADYAGSVTWEFLTIFAVNLAVAALVAAMNTLRSIRTPAGYVVVALIWVQGAITWGTNSLVIEAGRLEPSLSVLLGRSGIFELTAYVAVAVATREVMVWHQQSGPRWREEFERVRSPRDWHLSRTEWLVLVGAVVLLAAANYREAVMIAQAVQ